MAQVFFSSVVPQGCRNCPRDCECFKDSSIQPELLDYEQVCDERNKAILTNVAKQRSGHHNSVTRETSFYVAPVETGTPEKLDFLWGNHTEKIKSFRDQRCNRHSS